MKGLFLYTKISKQKSGRAIPILREMPILKSLFSNEGAFFVHQNLKTKKWESNPDTSGDADFKEPLQ